MFRCLPGFFFLLMLASALAADRYPADAGIINVRAAPYAAAGDGQTDDTAALQSAVAAAAGSARIVYLPAGVYRVRETLKPPADAFFFNLEGESAETTIIRLDPASDGFGDPDDPRPVVQTAEAAAGWTNNAFMTNVRNLTIEIGADNPGATALRYLGNNQSSVDRVVLRSLDSEGAATGIDMASFSLPGPGLIRGVTIDGFAYGIRMAFSQYGITLEDVRIRNATTAGIHLRENLLVARKLTVSTTTAAVPAIVIADDDAMLALLSSTLEAPAGEGAAIVSDGYLFLRDIAVSGYPYALQTGDTALTTLPREYTSHPVVSRFTAPPQSLDLPVADMPDIAATAPETWINAVDYGAQPGTDSTAALQAAIDATTPERSTVYLPHPGEGVYLLSGTVVLRGHLQRFVGMNASIKASPELRSKAKPMFLLTDGASPIMVIERLFVPWGTAGIHTLFVNERSQTTLFRHIFATQDQFYTGRDATGETHFVDVTAGHDGNDLGPAPLFVFGPHETIWARQLNPEIFDGHLLNDGATTWILGLKTEREGPLITNRNGGQLEIIGALIHPRNIGVPADMQVIINDQADLSFVGREANSNSASYQVLAEMWRNDELRRVVLADDDVPKVTVGGRSSFALPLLRASSADATPLRAVRASDQTSLNTIELSWDAVPGATQYEVGRSIYRHPTTRKLIGTTTAPGFVDAGLQTGATYHYWVRARVGGSWSGFSSAIPGRTAPGLAAAPAWVEASQGRFAEKIDIRWEWVQAASLYWLYRHTTDEVSAAARIATITDPTVTRYTDTDVIMGQDYYYWVRPFTLGYGVGPFSEAVLGYLGGEGFWAGYPYADDGVLVDTGNFLGVLGVQEPFVWSFLLAGWVYLPEAHVHPEGAWGYFFP